METPSRSLTTQRAFLFARYFLTPIDAEPINKSAIIKFMISLCYCHAVGFGKLLHRIRHNKLTTSEREGECKKTTPTRRTQTTRPFCVLERNNCLLVYRSARDPPHPRWPRDTRDKLIYWFGFIHSVIGDDRHHLYLKRAPSLVGE